MICCFCCCEPSPRQYDAHLMVASPDAMPVHGGIYAVISMFLSCPGKVYWCWSWNSECHPFFFLPLGSISVWGTSSQFCQSFLTFVTKHEAIFVLMLSLHELLVAKGTNLQYKLVCLPLIMHWLAIEFDIKHTYLIMPCFPIQGPRRCTCIAVSKM